VSIYFIVVVLIETCIENIICGKKMDQSQRGKKYGHERRKKIEEDGMIF